jgi:drug/metabolite transporter (DMT)-like permease
VVAVLDPGRIRTAALPGILLITLGIAIFVGESLREATASQLLGDALLLLASFCWSAYAVTARSLNISPIQTAAIVAVFSMMCFVPPYLAVNGMAFLQHAWPILVTQALIQGVLIGVVSIFAYTCAVTYLGASETSLFTAAVPTLTTLIAIPLLAEYPAPAEWIGVGVTTLGMIFAMRGYYKPQSTPQKRSCPSERASET